MSDQQLEGIDLEDIIKEFSDADQPPAEKTADEIL